MRYAVCNEIFGAMPFSRACRMARKAGFEGLELAPYTVFGSFTDHEINHALPHIAHVLKEEGLAFAGFHWLMAKPDGLHLASPDPFTRSRSWDHLRFLIDCAGALGGGVLVLGSPKQRSTPPGMTRAQVMDILAEGLATLAPHAEACRSLLLPEALSPDQSDVITSMEEAASFVRKADHPAIRMMFDFHNARDEKDPPEVLITRYIQYIAHIHINERDGGPPGSGSTDYAPSMKVLNAAGYQGWISMEIFSIPEEPEPILRKAVETMKMAEAQAMVELGNQTMGGKA
ncbi:MAG: sugar phosphate isomerase/epimerase [Rectinema sp.]|nr:sugar phosphate isomerase/epimerase [Rectinema sp.]